MSVFKAFGIYGWDSCQYSIISAIVADVSPLFIGSHGAYKTESCEILSRLILGDDCKLQLYDTSTLATEDLLGFPDPKSLSSIEKGKPAVIKFVHHKRCVWSQDAIVLDEINMASLSVVSKCHELVRNKVVMGEKTPVKLVFATLNPPKNYGTRPLTRAFASRFACISVPDVQSMHEKDLEKILETTFYVSETNTAEYTVVLRKAFLLATALMEDVLILSKVIEKMTDLVKRVFEVVKAPDTGCNIQARDLKTLLRMLVAMYAFDFSFSHYATENEEVVSMGDFIVDEYSILEVIIACIPEAHGVVVKSVTADSLKEKLMPVVYPFVSGAVVQRPSKLIIDGSLEDPVAYQASVEMALKAEISLDELKNCLAAIVENTSLLTQLNNQSWWSIVNNLVLKYLVSYIKENKATIMSPTDMWNVLDIAKNSAYSAKETTVSSYKDIIYKKLQKSQILQTVETKYMETYE